MKIHNPKSLEEALKVVNPYADEQPREVKRSPVSFDKE